MVTTRTKVFSFPHSRFIGFDHVWDEIEKLTAAGANEKGFPRHNIIKYTDTEYAMEFALGGYQQERSRDRGKARCTGQSGETQKRIPERVSS